MEVTKSTFSGNFALASGGATYNTGTLTVTNSTFSGNSTSTAPLPGDGGGIQNSGSLTVTNSTFSSNGGGPGGGISNASLASIKNTGRRDEGRAMLAEIYSWFTEGFDTLDLKDVKALLDELSA